MTSALALHRVQVVELAPSYFLKGLLTHCRVSNSHAHLSSPLEDVGEAEILQGGLSLALHICVMRRCPSGDFPPWQLSPVPVLWRRLDHSRLEGALSVATSEGLRLLWAVAARQRLSCPEQLVCYLRCRSRFLFTACSATFCSFDEEIVPRVQAWGRVTPFNKAIMTDVSTKHKRNGSHAAALFVAWNHAASTWVGTFLMSQGEGLSHNYVDLNYLPANPLAVLH